MYAFDCKPEGISARWEIWVRRLEESVFAVQNITDPVEKRGKLLSEGGEALYDIWDVISKDEETQPGQEYEELIRKLTEHFEQIKSSLLNIQNERFSTQFKNRQLLGKGGYGKVYKVEHYESQKFVGVYAVKEVHFRECSEKEVERVLQEVIHLAKLSEISEPHIVRYYTAWVESDPNPPPPTPDSSTSGSQSFSDSKECTKCKSGNWCEPFLLYIQMEHCDRTLANWLEERNKRIKKKEDVVNVTENELIMEQLLRGLDIIHAAEIIHRDLKPENIFMKYARDNRYRVKFGDFGLTRDTSVPQHDLTETQAHLNENLQPMTDWGDYTKGIGTCYYAAPEQLDTESKENYDHKADMYSLGVILYELYQPFTSQDEDQERKHLIAKLRGQKKEDVAKLKQALPNVARQILELLSLEPAKRPSASELLEKTEQQRMQHDRKFKDEVRSLADEIEGLQVKDAEKDQKAELVKNHAQEIVLEFGLSRV